MSRRQFSLRLPPTIEKAVVHCTLQPPYNTVRYSTGLDITRF